MLVSFHNNKGIRQTFQSLILETPFEKSEYESRCFPASLWMVQNAVLRIEVAAIASPQEPVGVSRMV